MTRKLSLGVRLLTFAVCCALMSAPLSADDLQNLAAGFENPPNEAKLRAYWWWLNGYVTKASITRDLEEMKAKGFGGALLCDADGSSQRGNDPAPHGPTFLTEEWRELYKHTLKEADRLGLEISLNIMSGWNLGGPPVTADDAGKKVVWSETTLRGPGKFAVQLPLPSARDDYYRDAYVVAYAVDPTNELGTQSARVTSNSQQDNHRVDRLADSNPNTFWVSAGGNPGDGPTKEKPTVIQIEFAQPVSISRLRLQPRPGYGPRECELQVSADGRKFEGIKQFTADQNALTEVEFSAVRGKTFQLLIFGSFDPRFPDSPRNVQISELQLSGPDGVWPGAERPRLLHWQQKAGHKPLHFSAPDTSLLLEQAPTAPGDVDSLAENVVDLTDCLDEQGVFHWDAPAGTWQILRFGYTISDRSHVSTSSEGWTGYALDVLDKGAFRRYWDTVVEPLITDAGPLTGTTLKYLHTDSWEIEPLNWTPTIRAEFQQRRGYDPLPWLPVLAGRIITSRDASNRFLNDFRKTLGDLVIDNHYRLFRDAAHGHGLLIHPESGGPHAVPIDAQRCLGFNDMPMSEFWAWSWTHRIGDDNRFFVKQPASAAHVYGRRLVAAEGFTTIGPHWQETLWDNLKPSFDKACCEGLNRLVWHAFVCSPADQGLPGIQYFAGTHLNPNVTWWSKSKPFFDYINRCQFLLQQGLFVADACYYYGDHVPNFTQHKRTDPAGVLPGYDYDVITEEALLTRVAVKDGRIVLPDGMSYRVLVLRNQHVISLPVLRKIAELVKAGATVIGPKPTQATSLQHSDDEVRQIANALWVKGKVIDGQSAREVLQSAGVLPDFEYKGGDDQTDIDYIHRRDGNVDIYFVASRGTRQEVVNCTFRVTGKTPQLWDPVSGHRRSPALHTEQEGRTSLPIQFPPCGSCFVIFGESTPADHSAATTATKTAAAKPVNFEKLSGPWQVTFDPKWGGPGTVEFPTLISWPKHENPGIKYYSGTAVYRKQFNLPGELPKNRKHWLDLGEVRELAEVKVNGKSCGVYWSPPFHVDISAAVKPGVNELEIEVVNFWPNRIIGDAALPLEKRLTRTNIRKLTAETELMPSGLMGPVQFLSTDETE